MENKPKKDLVRLASYLLCLNGAFLSFIYLKMIIEGVQISIGQNNNWSNIPFYRVFIDFHIPVLINLMMFVGGVFLFFRKRFGWLIGTITSLSLVAYQITGVVLSPFNSTAQISAFLLVILTCVLAFLILITRNARQNLQVTKPKVVVMCVIIFLIIIDIILVRT